MFRRASLLLLALALAVVSCSDKTGSNDLTDNLRTSGDSLALLTPLQDLVETRSKSEGEFTAATAREPIEHGHEIHTGDAGLADITYFEGSVTRLAPGTTYIVTGLSDVDEEREVHFNLTEGRVWNRVAELFGKNGSYTVVTSVGTVRVVGGPGGSAFDIECLNPKLCVFRNVEGEIDIELVDGDIVTLRKAQELTVEIDVGVSGPVTTSVINQLANEFIAEMEELDREAGFPRLGPEPQPEPSTTIATTTVPPSTTSTSIDPDDEITPATAAPRSSTTIGSTVPQSTIITFPPTTPAPTTTTIPSSYKFTASGEVTGAQSAPTPFAPDILGETIPPAVTTWPDHSVKLTLQIDCTTSSSCRVSSITSTRLAIYKAIAGDPAATISRGLAFDSAGFSSTDDRLVWTVPSTPIARSGRTLSGTISGSITCADLQTSISLTFEIDTKTKALTGNVDFNTNSLVSDTAACWLPDVSVG